MIKYSSKNISTDKPGEPTLPIKILIRKSVLEKLYKYSIHMVLQKKDVGSNEINEINQILKLKPIIFEGGRIDFNETENSNNIDVLTYEIIKKLYTLLNGLQFNKRFILESIAYVLAMILTKNRVVPSDIDGINRILRKYPVLYSTGRIRANSKKDEEKIEKAIDETWIKLTRELNTSDFRRAFVKKSMDKV